MEYEDPDSLKKAHYDADDYELNEEIHDIDSDLSERKQNKRSLEMRRSIEAYFDQKRIHEMHDYLADEDFVEDPEQEEGKTGKNS